MFTDVDTRSIERTRAVLSQSVLETVQVKNRLLDLTTNLSSDWQGQAKSKFVQRIQLVEDSMSEFIRNMEELETKLSDSARDYEKADDIVLSAVNDLQ